MVTDLYNNPEKGGVRRKLWLPRARQAVARAKISYPWREPRYLTFPGPNCLDLRLFVDKEKLFKTENVVAFEVRQEVARQILAEYPTLGRLYRNDYEEISRSGRFEDQFPFDVVNLDFNGNCFDNRSGGIPEKLEAVERTFQLQGDRYTSFDLFLTFEASHQPARIESDKDVAKILQDHATRLGFNEGYYRLAARGIRHSYELTMLETIPSVVIRMGWEAGFDTRLYHKAHYTPSGRRSRARLVTFVFESVWDYVPLSLPRWEWSSRIQARLRRRQEEALELPVTRFVGSNMRKT